VRTIARYRAAGWIVVVVLAGLFLGVTGGLASKAPSRAASLESPQEELYRQVELLAEAITVVRSEYVEEVEPKRLIYGALEGLVAALDRYSQFLTPEAYSEMQVETKGEFGGVGLEITLSKEGTLTVVAPLDDTPAAQAGLKPNDKIVKIDGISTRGMSLHEAVKRLRGQPGTQVTLTVFREEMNDMIDFTLTRSIVQVHSVKRAIRLDSGIGYIRISDFQDNTSADLDRALNLLRRSELTGLILDLRNNPGGLLDVAVDVAGRFLPKGTVVVSIRGRHKAQNQELVSQYPSPLLDVPMVVLVNGGSASASEIVAGALQDHGRAIVMGSQTFGKGSVQTVIPLRDGSAIRLTTSVYHTPRGEAIHGKGLKPDVPVSDEGVAVAPKPPKEFPEPDRPKELLDPVIVRAMDLLRGIKVYEERGTMPHTSPARSSWQDASAEG
jgi:carboxyl-terminal processing protease